MISRQFPEFVHIDPEGRQLMTGCLPRQSEVGNLVLASGRTVPVWDPKYDACPKIPRDQWVTQDDFSAYDTPERDCHNDQNGYPACTLASLATLMDFFLTMSGRAFTKLDWHKAWVALSGGSGGVSLDAALRYVIEKGFPLADGSGVLYVDEKEVWDLPDVEAYFSCRQKGVWTWHGRFMGRGGHAECGLRTKMQNGKAIIEVPGTWGRSYGNNGRYDVTEEQLDNGLGYFGGFGIGELKLRAIDIEAKD